MHEIKSNTKPTARINDQTSFLIFFHRHNFNQNIFNININATWNLDDGNFFFVN